MKIKKNVAVLIVVFLLISCAPAVIDVPTETSIPTFTPTVTATPLPTATSTPNYTPTPTPIPQAWIDNVKRVEGKTNPTLIGNKLGNTWTVEGSGWVIDKVSFDPKTLFEFPDHESMPDSNEPRFGLDEAGQAHLRCYGEITLPNKEKVITGFTWHQQLYQARLEDGNLYWLGVNYMLGAGISSNSAGETRGGYCKNVVNRFIEQGQYDTSFALAFIKEIGTNEPYRDEILSSLFAPVFPELAAPDEFWKTGDVNLLPKIDGKPFLLSTHFGFEQNK